MKTRLATAITVLAMASLLSAGSAFADNQQRDRDWQKGPPSVEQKLARISDALDLSDEQSAQMLRILQQQEQAKRARHDEIMALMGPEICAQRAEAEDAILSILDEEQTALYLEIRQQRQERGDKHRRQGRAGDPLDCNAFEGDDS